MKKILLIGGHVCAGKISTIHAQYPNVELHVLDIDSPEFQEVKETEPKYIIPIHPVDVFVERKGKSKFRDDFDKIPCPKPLGKKRFKNHKRIS